MARAATKKGAQRAKATPAAQPRRKGRSGPKLIEQTLFFTRLRRQAKWAFVLLVFVFAGGFVFFGVGSGSTGLGDLLRGNFNVFGSNNNGSTSSSAVKSALKKTKAHPKDPNAWNALATAYQSDGKLSDANKAYEHVLKLRPKDTSAIQSVAAYYETRAQDKATEAANLQAQAPLSLATVLGVSGSSKIGQALATDPSTQQLTEKANAATAEETTALQKDTQLYKRLAKL